MKLTIPPKITARLMKEADCEQSLPAQSADIIKDVDVRPLVNDYLYNQARAEYEAMAGEPLPPRGSRMILLLQPDGSMDVMLGEATWPLPQATPAANRPTPGGKLSDVVHPGNMNGLIQSFPSLRASNPPTWERPSAWIAWAHGADLGASSTAAAAFVLFVWNNVANEAGAHTKALRFDLGVAMNCWDAADIAAFTRWAAAPWFA